MLEEICVKILEDIYKENTATIRLYKINEKITIQKEARQSENISLKPFTMVL